MASTVATLVLTGCTSPAQDMADGRAKAQRIAESRLDYSNHRELSVHREHMLADGLSISDAVSLALAQQPRLTQAFSRLGIAAADRFEASRWANPSLSFSRLTGDGSTRSWQFGIDLADLLLWRQKQDLAERDFAALRIEVAAAIVDVARDTEHAWYRHVAAEQIASLYAATAEAAAASTALAKRLHEAGNISRLQWLRARASSEEARVSAMHAENAMAATRRDLNLIMGMRGADAQRWQTPSVLPLPVTAEPKLETLISDAEEHRLDLVAGRMQVALLEAGQQLAHSWGWLGRFDFDYEWERESGGSRMRGPGLSLQLPLFSQGQAQQLRADAQLMRGRAELKLRELQVELDVREAFERLLRQREIVEAYRGAIVPARSEAVERQLERYNFMLIGTFELLETRQQEYQAYADYIEAVRDYWLARTELAHAVGRSLPGAPSESASTPDLKGVIHPAEAEMDSNHHNHASGDRS